jgi:hypothetical protein
MGVQKASVLFLIRPAIRPALRQSPRQQRKLVGNCWTTSLVHSRTHPPYNSKGAGPVGQPLPDTFTTAVRLPRANLPFLFGGGGGGGHAQAKSETQVGFG